MAENQRDQQGQKNPQDQNRQQQPQGQSKPQGNPGEQREEEEQEGTKLPGKETRTPTAEDGNRDAGTQQRNQQGNTPTA